MVAIRTAEAKQAASRETLQAELFLATNISSHVRFCRQCVRMPAARRFCWSANSIALKRRCLYHWVDFPDFDREMDILAARAPEVAEAPRREVVSFVLALRTEDIFKTPGVAKTIDCAKCLLAPDVINLRPDVIADTQGAILKYQDDIQKLQGSEAKRILDSVKSSLATT